MKLNKHREKSVMAWVLRALVGPAAIVDGVVATLSIGSLSTGCALAVARKLALVRMGQ